MSVERPSRPMVVAHRGASLEQPENTIEAFEAAIDAGADAVEFDVRMTADGHAVVMHDPDVSRTTDGTGLVSELTLDDVRRLRIPLPDGGVVGVPTLREALECLSGRATADIEIKNLPGEPGFTPDREPAVEATVAALDDVGFTDPVIVSSFNPRSIAHSRHIRPEVATGLLTSYEVDAAVALAKVVAEGHPWALPFVTKVLEAGEGFGTEVRNAGALLGVWIADDPETARRLFELGADAVATNDPRAIVPVRNGVSAQVFASVFRRRKLPDDLVGPLEGLRAVVAEVEAAKNALTGTVPSTRTAGTPLAEGIHELESRLGSAQALMPAWRHPDVDEQWRACDAGIRESLDRARRLREDPPELAGFEGLIWAVDRLLEPLEAFEAAAERFRTLRR